MMPFLPFYRCVTLATIPYKVGYLVHHSQTTISNFTTNLQQEVLADETQLLGLGWVVLRLVMRAVMVSMLGPRSSGSTNPATEGGPVNLAGLTLEPTEAVVIEVI